MSERNKVRIKCNPFSKEIMYYLWDSENGIWCGMSEDSALTRGDFTKATIQNKAQDILTEVNETHNMGNIGLDIVFEGTDDDYHDLEFVREAYFREYDIRCVKGETYVETAENVMKEIDCIFQKIDAAFEQYQDRDIKDTLARYHDATRKTIPICVMGLYSSGKSAFLNCLIGDEVLPSSTDPTTAKNYRISSGNSFEVSFKFGKGKTEEERETVKLRFSNGNYTTSVNDNAKFPILSVLQKAILDKDADPSPQARMYRAISVINNYDKTQSEQCVSDLVNIVIPFHKSFLPLDQYDFVFYDTPGSDSISNEKHKIVLEAALEGQTNGLPIFITTPDSMDKESNVNLINSIDRFAAALDQTNMMIVVNRSDSYADSDLKKKSFDSEQLKLKSWKSTRIYFVSAVMGLGSKKDNPKKKTSWTDDTYRQTFKHNVDDFSDPDSDDYKKLYQFNILPRYRYDAYCSEAAAIDGDASTTSEQRIFYNSGMHCVESEILEFCKRYALYSKCLSAKDYLVSAGARVHGKIISMENELRKKREETKEKLDEKTAFLLQRLNAEAHSLFSKFSGEYAEPLSALQKDFNADADSDWIKEEWKRIKKKYKSNERISAISDCLRLHFLSRTADYARRASNVTHTFWTEKTDVFKQVCIQIVTETPYLSLEQKTFLQEYILKVERMHIDDIKQERYGVWGVVPRYFLIFPIGKKFDLKKSIDEFISDLKGTIAAASTSAQQKYSTEFINWGEDLLRGLEGKMADFNPDLHAYSTDIVKYQGQIKELQNQQRCISEQIVEVEALMSFKEVSVSE